MKKDYLKLPIAVIGAGSMVGSRFCDLTRDELKLIEADVSGQNAVDITSEISVEDFFKAHDFGSIILFSAYTDVDGAEAQRGDKNGICWKINVSGVENIVKACNKYKRKLIFISTEFVFDGIKGLYSEDDKVGPDLNKVSWYGISKIEGEKNIESNLDDYLILRITYPFRGKYEKKEDILKKILKLAIEGRLYPMFSDQKTTPTFIDDIPQAVKLLLVKNQKGIFHIASPKIASWYEIACFLLKTFGLESGVVKEGSLKDFLKAPGRTPRPINGGLNVAKIVSLGFNPTSYEEGIKKIFEESKGDLVS